MILIPYISKCIVSRKKDKDMLVDGDNNIQVSGDNNSININSETNFVLDEIDERFRNAMMDFFCLIVLFFVGQVGFIFSSLAITVILATIVLFIYLVAMPKFYPIMYIHVYNDKLVYEIDKVVHYADIRDYYLNKKVFIWRFASFKLYRLFFHSSEQSTYVFNCIYRYSVVNKTLIR